MRLVGAHLASHGSSLGTYFRLLRPRGVSLDFREILKRVNTPFMFCLKVPGSASPAEVGYVQLLCIHILIIIAIHLKGTWYTRRSKFKKYILYFPSYL